MRMRRAFTTMSCVVLLTLPGDALAVGDQQIYAAPAGHGVACSLTQPCALAVAQQRTRKANKAMESVTVHLAAGRYRITRPWTFGPADSGTQAHPIVWTGPASGEAVIDGGVPVRGWRLADAKQNIWQAKLTTGQYALQLYVNGVRAARARREGCRKEDCSYTQEGLRGATAKSIARLKHPEDVVAVFGVRWRDFHCRIQSVQGDTLKMSQPCWHNTVIDSIKNGWSNASPKGKPYAGVDWFENAYEFLGTPGEFYIDRRINTVYYVPRKGEDLHTADVELPQTEQLLQIHGSASQKAHDIRFEHLSFEDAGWLYEEASDGYVPLQAGYLIQGNTRNDLPHNGEGLVRIPVAVEVLGAERVQLDRDNFQHLGAAGVAVDDGTHESAITRSNFQDISGGAVLVGDTVGHPQQAANRSGSNIVSRNEIAHVALEYRDNVGIMGGFNNGLSIDHNNIHDVPYSAISVGWGWNYEGEEDVQRDIHIRSNRIWHFMQTLHDGGAIYTQAQSPGSDVVENYISYRDGDNGNGIYLDERSRKYTVCGNVVWDIPKKMQEGQWISTWSSWSGNLDIHDNWSDDTHTALHNPGPTKQFYDNHLALKDLPDSAQQVIDASGTNGPDALVSGCLQRSRGVK